MVNQTNPQFVESSGAIFADNLASLTFVNLAKHYSMDCALQTGSKEYNASLSLGLWLIILMMSPKLVWELERRLIHQIKILSKLVMAPNKYRNVRGVQDLSFQDLRYRDFSNMNLSKCNLTGANLMGCCLARCNLEDARLDGANLTNANLSEANCSRGIRFPTQLHRIYQET